MALFAHPHAAHDDGHAHGHSHGHDSDHDHGHTHGVMDATIASTDRGIYAIKWSFIIMFAVALVELVIVGISGSVALLADMIHNFADATTAIPLFVAFRLVRRLPTKTFNYGLGRVEDLAGLLIVLIILFSTVVAGYEAIERLLHPQPLTNIGWVALMGVISYAGNEAVARLRIRIGKEINSAALIADGYHARIDARTSLAVVAGAALVWFGFPLADPIVGVLITLSLVTIVWQSSRTVLVRMLDGIDPGLHPQIHDVAAEIEGISALTEVKARWIGHQLHVDTVIDVPQDMSLAQANSVASQFRRELFAHIPALTEANVRYHDPKAQARGHADAQPHGHHHHAPEPFLFDIPMAKGELSIIDTAAGERFALKLFRHAPNFSARVEILREAGSEWHDLLADPQDHHRLLGQNAPEEPHEFSAKLHISTQLGDIVLPFDMHEPSDHAH